MRRLEGWARELGFSQIGVSEVDLGDAAEDGLRAWLEAGFHGSMGYMAAHGMKRARPAELQPGALRIITARMDYLPESRGEDWQAQEEARLTRPGEAVISMYARGRDYHKVLRNRLQKLADRLADEIGPLGHRCFTDSAPVLEVELATRSGLGKIGEPRAREPLVTALKTADKDSRNTFLEALRDGLPEPGRILDDLESYISRLDFRAAEVAAPADAAAAELAEAVQAVAAAPVVPAPASAPVGDGIDPEIREIFKQAVELEYRYAEDTMPRGVLGLNASMFKSYLRFICNRRCQQIGLDPLYPNEENPFPWMSEMIDLKKERNFFETRVIEYQTGGALTWE